MIKISTLYDLDHKEVALIRVIFGT